MNATPAADPEVSPESLADQLARRRLGLREVAAMLGQCPPSALWSFEYKRVLLGVLDAEYQLVSAAAHATEPDGSGYPSGWRGNVVDSILLALMWGDLRTEHLSPRPAQPSSDRGAILDFCELLESRRADLSDRTTRLDGATEEITGILDRARNRYRRLGDDATEVLAGGVKPPPDDEPVVDGQGAPNPDARPVRVERLSDFLARTVAALRAVMASEGVPSLEGLSIELADGATPAMSEPELKAVAHGDDPNAFVESPESELLLYAGALSVKVAADLGLLRGAPKGLVLERSTDAEEFSADLDAVDAITRVTQAILLFARNQGRSRLMATLEPMRRRIEKLAATLAVAVGPDRSVFPARVFEFALDPESLRATGALTTRAPVAPPPRAAPKPKARSRKEGSGPGVGKILAVVVSLGMIAGSIAYGVKVILPHLKKPKPEVISSTALQEFAPGAEFQELSPAEKGIGFVRLKLSREFLELSSADRHARIIELCLFLSKNHYKRAEINDYYGSRVAAWEKGQVTMEGVSPGAPQSSASGAR